jgi:hypothetical protein
MGTHDGCIQGKGRCYPTVGPKWKMNWEQGGNLMGVLFGKGGSLFYDGKGKGHLVRNLAYQEFKSAYAEPLGRLVIG